MGKTKTYKAFYARENLNPFRARPPRGADFCSITVELTAAQAKEKDKLAAGATPAGFGFLRCEELSDGG